MQGTNKPENKIDWTKFDKAIICISDWYFLSICNGDRKLQEHYENFFGCDKWDRDSLLQLLAAMPYDNPFEWDFQLEHRYNLTSEYITRLASSEPEITF